MCAVLKANNRRAKCHINNQKEQQTHLFLHQIVLLPTNNQDSLIEEISNLEYCTKKSISAALRKYDEENEEQT